MKIKFYLAIFLLTSILLTACTKGSPPPSSSPESSLPIVADDEKPTASNEAPSVQEELSNSSIEVFVEDGKSGLISADGEILLPAQYGSIEQEGSGYLIRNYLTEDEGLYLYLFNVGFANSEGKLILPVEHDYIGYNDEKNLGIAYKDGKSRVFDEQGNLTFDMIYENLQSPGSWEASQNFIYAALDGRYGYVSPENELLIDFKYDYVDVFENGYAMVFPEHKLFWKIDENGDSIPDFVIYQYQIIDTEENILYTSPYLKEDWDYVPLGFVMDFVGRDGLSYPVFELGNATSESVDPTKYQITLNDMYQNVFFEIKNTEYTPSEDALPYIVYNIDINTPYTLIPLP